MKHKYRFGVIGFAHLHVLELMCSFLALPDQFEFIGAADTTPMNEETYQGAASRYDNRLRFVQKMGASSIFENVEALLDAHPDLILVTTEHAVHGSVLPQILSRGIHVVVDKPLAVSERDALSIRAASEKGHALCVTNWFSYWKPGIRLAKQLIDSGIIGDVYRFQYRNPDSLGVFSNRENMCESDLQNEWWFQLRCGGGSMIDYCSYGIVLSDWFFRQQPQTVFGIKKNFHQKFCDAEDYAALILSYPEFVSLIEGTWTTLSSGLPTGPILWGSKGSLIVENYNHSSSTKVCLYQTPYASVPDKVFLSDDYPLPEGHRNLAEDIWYYLQSEKPLPYILSLDCNVKASHILDLGRKSAETGQIQYVKSF